MSHRHPRSPWLVLGVTILTTALVTGCGRSRPPLEVDPPGLYAPSLAIDEGASGQATTVVDLEVVLKPARQSTVTVQYALVDGTAKRGEDYLAATPSGTLTFAAGETRKKIRVEIVDDDLYEGQGEVFYLELSQPQGADLVEAQGVITIRDYDAQPIAALNTDVVSLPESVDGNGDFRRVEVRVTLDRASGLPALVPVNTNRDFMSAAPYGDYRLLDVDGKEMTLPLRFQFAPGETEKRFFVEVIDDGAAEADESIVLGVTDDIEAARRRSDPLIEITIQDDDRPDYAGATGRPLMRLNDTGVLRYAYHLWWDEDGDGQSESEVDDHSFKAPYLQRSDIQEPTSILDLRFYDGQDALYGRDAEAVAASGDINAAGFRFTRLGPDGQPMADQNDLDYDANPWHCVRDEVTGLIWEVKTALPGHLHNESRQFYWYEADAAANGGQPGNAGLPSCPQESCAVSTFVARANLERWCGRTGWRLPTLEELRSIADYGGDADRNTTVAAARGALILGRDSQGTPVTRAATPAPLDAFYFPNFNPTRPYWSSTPVGDDPSQVWGIRFMGVPLDERIDKSDRALVRLVNDGP